jgi:hypothetical protein
MGHPASYRSKFPRIFLFAGFGLVLACGGLGGEGGENGEDCTPLSCEEANKDCGNIADGCGGTVSCGACPDGQNCGGGGAANVCGFGECTPTTCEASGLDCGSHSDGCGDVLQCGSCASGLTCGGGGTPGVCGDGDCTPTTCAAAGASCGSVADGCGGVLSCGGCDDGLSCGGGGEENVCGRTCEQGCPDGWECNRAGVCVDGDLTGLVLDVRTVTVSGHVTHNGSAPAIDCPWEGAYLAHVRFVETTHGYSFTHTVECGEGTTGIEFEQLVFPGTYQVSVRGEGTRAGIPSTYYTTHESLVLEADQSGLVLDVRTVTVSGHVTHNGSAPAIDCPWEGAYLAHVRFVETTHGYSFTHTVECEENTTSIAFEQLVFPGTYQVSVRGEGTRAGIPSTYYTTHDALSITANQSGLVLDVRTVTVSGHVTHSGSAPAIDCPWEGAYLAHVRFVETTHGYSFTHTAECEETTTSIDFEQLVFPGTYRVSVRGEGTRAGIPSTYYTTHDALSITANQSGLVLDVRTVTVSGHVTHNGSAPAIDCPWEGAYLAHIRFVETTHGYSFTHTVECEENTTSIAFEQLVFPGTYQVSVRGEGTRAGIPSTYYVARNALALTANQGGLVLDVRTVTVSGHVTHNGSAPAIDCPWEGAYLAHVRFVETTHGYSFTHTVECEEDTTSIDFEQLVFPGTYRVSVRGEGTRAGFPSTYYTTHDALPLTADQGGLVLDVRTVTVSGHVTHNGSAPAVDCPWEGAYLAHVRFVETTHGYSFTHTVECEENTASIDFEQRVFPGIYQVSVRGEGTRAGIPSTYYVALPRIALR